MLEYILSLKTENWSTVLGSNFPSNLVTLLEAFIHKKVEKHSYYFSGNEGEKYSDSFYLSNRGIKKLSEIGLITEKFYENIKSYPYPHADNFSYKKDTYEVKCTPKGKKVAIILSIRSMVSREDSKDLALEESRSEDRHHHEYTEYLVSLSR